MLSLMSASPAWIVAAYHGACSGCGDDIEPDDMIRADGSGGWLCEPCGWDEEGWDDDEAS